METIIPLIIMLIVGSLFKKKKAVDEPANEQSKPSTTQQESPSEPVKTLKEKSQEMYRELQREMQQESEGPTRQAAPEVVMPRKLVEEKVPVLVESKVSRKEHVQSSRTPRRSNRVRGRSSAPAQKRLQVQTIKSSDYLPKSEQDLIKGVIFSEIFGPPKSKQ